MEEEEETSAEEEEAEDSLSCWRPPSHAVARRLASLQAIGPVIVLQSAPPLVIIACSKLWRPP
uniref:Uncharacterized protein n=1 Tax=Oryza sativa subsp. japonica TaxID=39947 RepID=Q84ZE2_ORYSJ|nr:hypothetical protein [Oryza sativa Japonica Group]